MASSSSSLPDRARRFVWEPGDVEPVVSEATDEELLREVNKRALLEHVTGPGHGPKAQGVHAGGSWSPDGKGVPSAKPKKNSMERHHEPGTPIFRDKEGEATGVTFTAERQALHAELRAKRLDGVKDSPGPVTLTMTGGGAASGKSSSLIENDAVGIPKKGDAAHIDPDSVKKELPEYQAAAAAGRDWAAGHVHEESSTVAKRAAEEGLKSGKDVVYDTVGDGDLHGLSSKVQKFRNAGAKVVNAEYAVVSLATAQKRSYERATLKTLPDGRRNPDYGRHVDPKVLRGGHESVSQTVPQAMRQGVFDRCRVWNTETKGKPLLIAEADRDGNVTIHRQDDWDAWLQIGQNAGVNEAYVAEATEDGRVVSKWNLGCMERVQLDVLAGIAEKDSCRIYPPEARKYRREFEDWVASLPPGSIVDMPDSGANDCWDTGSPSWTEPDLTTQQG